MCLVSVIIPSYNRAPLVAQAIKSALAQTLSDIEIIVVDDGSTDNTEEIVRRFRDKRLKYVYQKNSGVSAARNTGIEASRGKYIAFLDSDDILMEKALEKGAQTLDKYINTVFSYGQAFLMDEKQRIFGLRKQKGKNSYVAAGKYEIREALINGNHVPTSTILVRRAYLNNINQFDTSFNNGSEDFDFWVRLGISHQVAYIAEPLVIYRVHSNSICRTHRLAEIENNNSLIFNKIMNDSELRDFLSYERLQVYLHMYLRLADYACGSREMQTARNYLLKALNANPGWFANRLWVPLITRFLMTWFPPVLLDAAHRIKRWINIFVLQIPRIRFKRPIPELKSIEQSVS
jgi:glycosyltransferase involved in cell wall biosynthesis